MTQKAINYAEVLCELNIDAAELSDMEAVVREILNYRRHLRVRLSAEKRNQKSSIRYSTVQRLR